MKFMRCYFTLGEVYPTYCHATSFSDLMMSYDGHVTPLYSLRPKVEP